MKPQFELDPTLIERYIMELARFGGVGESGVSRATYTPEWVAAADQYAKWCEQAGLAVHRDAVGNIWGKLEGDSPGGSIVSGSHIDSQLPGGKYDGALGAVTAMFVLQSLKAQFGAPKRTIEAVAFCEEEGSRFASANFWGSRAVTGRIKPDEADQVLDYGGLSIGNAMRAIGLDPSQIPSAARDDIDTFIELHIEQGPILEHAQLPVGIVTGITGLRHYVVEVAGETNHAGAFPMDLRHDAMAGAAEMIQGVIGTATTLGRPAVTTVGRIHADPGYPAIIPGRASFTIDVRHPDAASLQKLFLEHERLLQEVAEHRGLRVNWKVTLDQQPSPSDVSIVNLLQESARQQDIPFMLMHSGAGHDSQIMAKTSKIGMIFVQSRRGRSHTPDEFTEIEHIMLGARTLAAALYKLAYC